jgi:hypothetical protein
MRSSAWTSLHDDVGTLTRQARETTSPDRSRRLAYRDRLGDLNFEGASTAGLEGMVPGWIGPVVWRCRMPGRSTSRASDGVSEVR